MSTRTTGSPFGWTVVRAVPYEDAPQSTRARSASRTALAIGLGALTGVLCCCIGLWAARPRHTHPKEAAHA